MHGMRYESSCDGDGPIDRNHQDASSVPFATGMAGGTMTTSSSLYRNSHGSVLPLQQPAPSLSQPQQFQQVPHGPPDQHQLRTNVQELQRQLEGANESIFELQAQLATVEVESRYRIQQAERDAQEHVRSLQEQLRRAQHEANVAHNRLRVLERLDPSRKPTKSATTPASKSSSSTKSFLVDGENKIHDQRQSLIQPTPSPQKVVESELRVDLNLNTVSSSTTTKGSVTNPEHIGTEKRTKRLGSPLLSPPTQYNNQGSLINEPKTGLGRGAGLAKGLLLLHVSTSSPLTSSSPSPQIDMLLQLSQLASDATSSTWHVIMMLLDFTANVPLPSSTTMDTTTTSSRRPIPPFLYLYAALEHCSEARMWFRGTLSTTPDPFPQRKSRVRCCSRNQHQDTTVSTTTTTTTTETTRKLWSNPFGPYDTGGTPTIDSSLVERFWKVVWYYARDVSNMELSQQALRFMHLIGVPSPTKNIHSWYKDNIPRLLELLSMSVTVLFHDHPSVGWRRLFELERDVTSTGMAKQSSHTEMMTIRGLQNTVQHDKQQQPESLDTPMATLIDTDPLLVLDTYTSNNVPAQFLRYQHDQLRFWMSTCLETLCVLVEPRESCVRSIVAMVTDILDHIILPDRDLHSDPLTHSCLQWLLTCVTDDSRWLRACLPTRRSTTESCHRGPSALGVVVKLFHRIALVDNNYNKETRRAHHETLSRMIRFFQALWRCFHSNGGSITFHDVVNAEYPTLFPSAAMYLLVEEFHGYVLSADEIGMLRLQLDTLCLHHPHSEADNNNNDNNKLGSRRNEIAIDC